MALAALALVASLGFSGQASADITDVPCLGAPQDYRIANDMRDGLLDDQVSYPEARIFLESQSHLKPPNLVMINEFEHLHVGACFPYAEKWVQAPNARTMDFRLVFHRVQNYDIVNFGSSFVHNGGSGGGFTATADQKAQLETAMDNSAGSTRTVFQSFALGSNNTSCRKSYRPSLKTDRANPEALVDEWEAAGQWTTYFDYPGQAICTPEFTVDQIRARSWIQPNGGYIYTTIYDLPSAAQLSIPRTGTFDFTVGVSRRPFTVYVDPDLHASPDNPGIWHKDYPKITDLNASTLVPVSIPLDDIPAGVHKVVVISGGGFQAAIQAFPFVKAGDTQAPFAPGGLVKSNPQPSSLVLSWNASTDNVGVAGYRIYRDGAQVADVVGTSATVGGLASASHLLEVEAYDAAGNVSARGSVIATRSWK